MPINEKEQLILADNNIDIHSWQRLVSGDFLIHIITSNEPGVIVLNLDSPIRNYEAVTVLVNGEELTASALSVTAKQLIITLPQQAKQALEMRLSLQLKEKPQIAATDSRCFIASAIYPNQPKKLKKIRGFRDEILLPLPGGKFVVQTYYKYSPQLVLQMQKSPKLKLLLTKVLNFFVE